jgi:hypothetical protein
VKIAKPLLIATTVPGLAIGLYEGWRLAGGLVVLPIVMILGLGAAFAGVILTIRRERAEEEERS